MPITFQSRVHELVHGKVHGFLSELPRPYSVYNSRPSFDVEEGSARVFIRVDPYMENSALVRVISYVVSGARVDDPELLRFLSEKNANLFAGFGIDSDNDIFFSYTMLGAECTRENLNWAISVVGSVADEHDDIIREKWGGRRAVEDPPKEGQRIDDPSKRSVRPPTEAGIGDGKVVYFLFGLKLDDKTDQSMLTTELQHIDDDVEALRGAGYTVVVDPQATRQDLLEALCGKGEGAVGLAPAAIYWSAHGNADGSVEACDGSSILPSEIDPATVSPALRLVIFSSCYVGARARTWRKALGGNPMVVGWGRPVTLERVVDFLDPDEGTSTDLDDLIRRYLLSDTPIPAEGHDICYPPGSEAAGHLGDVPQRLESVAAMLGATVSEAGNHALVKVALEGGRSHQARVNVVESAQPFAEGEPLLAIEADVGELGGATEVLPLLTTVSSPGYARLSLVGGVDGAPKLVVQGFLPLARVRDQDLAALIFQVCERANALEHRVFGTNT